MSTEANTTEGAEAALRKVFSSLQAAGDHWAPGGTLKPTEKGFEAVAELTSPLPKDAREAVREYIRLALRDLGWRARASISERQVRVRLSKL